MAKFRKKAPVVEAITFDELIAHGLANGANVVNGMPWSFQYNGLPVSHETDNWYLVLTPDGSENFRPGDMLVTNERGETYACGAAAFAALYEPA